MDRAELRDWIADARRRHDRDRLERQEPATPLTPLTREEVMDAIWGRLPVEVRRSCTRAQVQASLQVSMVREAVARQRGPGDPVADRPGIGG